MCILLIKIVTMPLQYSGVEIAIKTNLNQRNQYLPILAKIKQKIAKAERTIAHCRAKEMLVLYHMHSINEQVAEKRVLQADINVERTTVYSREAANKPRPTSLPEDLIVTLSRPTGSNMNGLGLI